METVCQVNFNLMTSKEGRRAEAILREYLLRVCDQVYMTRKGSSFYSLFSILPTGLQFRGFTRMLNPDDVAERNTDHWTFNLTDNVKNLLNQATLLFNGSGRFFYGFADPKFTRDGNEMAAIITNERLMSLYIPDDDKAQLAAQGVYLDSPEFP